MFTCVSAPQAQVNMGTTTGLIEERLGCKGGEQIKGSRYTSYRLTYEANVVSCSQRTGVVNG